MARLGLDYGTTNTVVVCSDRGRYPVVPHLCDTAVGPVARETFPSLIVYDRELARFQFGPDAERSLMRPDAEQRCVMVGSLKRLIRDYAEGVRIASDLVPGGFDPRELLTAFAGAVRASILRSGLFDRDEPLEAVLTWPANANGAQRYLTRRCFRDGGFEIVGTLNEPAAAAIEFADRMARGNRMETRTLSLSIAVFDLGGGTFDVSLLRIRGADFSVVCASGIEQLGGDDFDRVLAERFARQLNADLAQLRPFQQFRLLQHARQQKESIGSGAMRSLTLAPEDVGLRGPVCTVSVASYFEELETLLAPAMDKLKALVDGPSARAAGINAQNLDAVYLVGGSSKLPLVPQLIARRFPGTRLIMTDKPFTSTAMGAAIQSTEEVRLHDVLARTFGVLRLAEHGTREYFDPIFPAGTRLPKRGEPDVVHRVEYVPHHNIGRLRYLECTGMDASGRPADGVRAWSEVLFPYDPAILPGARLTVDQVGPREELFHNRIEETYSCDADGVITVRITRSGDGLTALHELFKG